MGYIFGGNTGVSYEQLQQQRKALEARKGRKYAPTDIGSGLSALGHAFGMRIADSRLKKAETARQGRSDNVFSAFQTILSGGAETAPPQSPEAFSSVPATTTDMPPIEWGGNDLRDGIAATAQSLGVDPIDLATAMSYETAGTLSPTKRGPTTQWGQHRGLIQFGEPQAKKYGVDWNNPVGSQLGPDGAVAKYLRDTGVKPGMGLLDIYSAINAGGVGLYNRSDANNGGAPGTVRDKVEKQMAGHRAKALAMFKDYQPRQAQPVQLASLEPSAGAQMPVAPQNEQQQPAQSALQILTAQRHGGGQSQPRQPIQTAQTQTQKPFGGVDPRLIQMMGDPSLAPQRRSTMQFLLEQHLKANAPMDPLKALQIQKMQRDMDAPAERKIIEGADGFKYYQDNGSRVLPNVQLQPEFQMLTPDQVQQLGLPAGSYQQNVDGKISQIGGGGVNVTVGGDDFKVPVGFKRNPDDLGAVIPIPGGPQDPNTPTNSNTTQIQRVNNAATAIQEGLTAYEDLVNQYGAEVLPGKGKDALLASRRDLQLQMKELFNLGVLNGPDLDLMNELLIDPTSLATAAQGTIGGMFGGDSVQDRASANIQQLREQFERLRKSQTPEGFGERPDDTDPLGLGKF